MKSHFNVSLLEFELRVGLNKVNTETLRISFILFESPSFFPDRQNRIPFYSNNDKTWVIILKENDFKESEKADAQNIIQSDLKIVNYQTLHNRGIGTLKQSDHKM